MAMAASTSFGRTYQESKDKTKIKGRRRGKDKGKMRAGRRVNCNAILKAVTPKEQQRHKD
jgi:predicted transposase YdaD